MNFVNPMNLVIPMIFVIPEVLNSLFRAVS